MYTVQKKLLAPLNFDFIQTVLTPSVLIAVTSHGLFESLSSQLQNALSFESEAAHLRSRGHGRGKVHVFKAAILSRKKDEYRNNSYTIVLKIF